MLNFHSPTLEDKAWVDALLEGTEYFGCFCTFATFYLWKDLYATDVARLGGAFLTRGRDDEGNVYYMYPLGREYDIRACIAALRADAAALGGRLLIYCAEQWQCDELRAAFPEEFAYEETRSEFDYLYRSEHLIELSGKKLHAKRNHVSKFMRMYPDWVYETITTENLPECIDFAANWLEQAIAGEDDEERVRELCMENSAIALALRHYKTLGMVGGLLRVGGRVIAITLGEPLNRRVFVTHFEKADTEFDGAYAAINQQFAANQLASYEYINREEDMGLEGLRKAKLSYHPDILLEKYCVKDISTSLS